MVPFRPQQSYFKQWPLFQLRLPADEDTPSRSGQEAKTKQMANLATFQNIGKKG
jgi:hypothetical protein